MAGGREPAKSGQRTTGVGGKWQGTFGACDRGTWGGIRRLQSLMSENLGSGGRGLQELVAGNLCRRGGRGLQGLVAGNFGCLWQGNLREVLETLVVGR